MIEMDRRELMAYDLERAQEKRYRKHQKNKRGDTDAFWTRDELDIFAFINILRVQSKSYHPDNSR